jgi:N2-acetyl-L-2,4-diaminobutanoate deacetylase
MKATEFDLQQFGRGQKHSFDLELDGDAKGINLPVLLVCGRNSGPTLVATAGVHGDEYEGVRTIFDIHATLDPEEMSGTFLAVPVSNPPAFWNGTRLSPLDGKNLARVFPGRLDDGPTSATAHYLAQSIIACADFYIDLHSAGVKLLMPTMIGYDAHDPRSLAAAYAFGAPVMWGHPNIEPGRTISFAKARGIPSLYAEARGGGRIHPDDLRIYTQGVCNLMVHLGILPGEVRQAHPRFHLYGDGNTDASLAAGKSGFLIPSVALLQDVKAGDELGRVVSLHGETLETISAPCGGVVALIRQWPVVEPGEPTFLITGVQSEK